jgi:hypothetical protein
LKGKSDTPRQAPPDIFQPLIHQSPADGLTKCIDNIIYFFS